MPSFPATPQSNLPVDMRALALSLLAPAPGGSQSAAFLKMSKQGEWLYGLNADHVPEDQQFLVNPEGFSHGWICWSEGGEKLNEVYTPRNQPLTEPGPVPVGGRGWEYQEGVSLKGHGGPLADQEFTYRVSSVGGKRAVISLRQLVGLKLQAAATDPRALAIVAVVTLACDSYQHRNKSFGEIFVPEFNIAKWIPMPQAGAQPVQLARAKAAKALVEARKANGKRR